MYSNGLHLPVFARIFFLVSLSHRVLGASSHVKERVTGRVS